VRFFCGFLPEVKLAKAWRETNLGAGEVFQKGFTGLQSISQLSAGGERGDPEVNAVARQRPLEDLLAGGPMAVVGQRVIDLVGVVG
jgi:hypothetical protein